MSSIPAWSYSSITTYITCPKKYEAEKVTKEVKFTDSEATIYGKDLHLAAEEYIRDGKSVPAQFSFIQPMLDKLKAMPGEKHCEMKVGIARRNGRLEACDFFAPDVWFRGVADLVIINGDTARIVDYKGLALDTKIPTPTGFTTMREIQVGDTVFSENGKQCKVVGKSDVKNIKCFKLTFDDKTTIICDENHLWKLHDGSVVNVKDLSPKRVTKKQRVGVPKVLTSLPLELPISDLPIDPYVLGLWLADGTARRGEISKPDIFVFEEVERRGYTLGATYMSSNNACPTVGINKLRTQLRENNLLNNKHIPAVYLRAGYQQRLDLLRGLMDGDGSVNSIRKQAVFMNTNESLSDSVCELLSTLGQRPLKSKTKQTGFGLTVDAYPVSFRPIQINPFLLPRKADKVDPNWGAGESWFRYIRKIEEVPSVPTQCIMVDSDDHTFLCTDKMIPTHNTGKSAKYADTKQLALMAAAVFLMFPEVKHIKAGLLFVVSKNFIKEDYTFERRFDIFATLDAPLRQLEASYETNVWNPKPNGLCKKWCDALSCPHNGKR